MSTQEERLAIIDRLRASGMLPRYRIRLPKRFSTLRELCEWEAWRIRAFGRRSSRKYIVRTRSRILYPLFKAVDARKPPSRFGRSRLWWRAHDAFLERS